ncbi:MAG: hypothetical protein ABIH28_03175 [archaeon]
MIHSKEAIKAIGIFLGTLAGTMAVIGFLWNSNYEEYNNRIIKQGNEIRMAKTCGPFSYLEFIIEKGEPKSISRRSSLTDNIILGFNLNSEGKVEEMVEDFSLYWKPKLRTSSPEKNKTVNWPAINQTAQGYIAYFQKEK